MTTNAPEKEKDKVKPYDFKSNILLQPEEIKSVRMAAESFAEMLSLSFSAHLTEPFTARYLETVVNRFGQVVKQLASPAVLVRMKIDGLEGDAVFQYDREMMFMLVDGFMGGDSKPGSKTGRDITEFEEKIVIKITERILRHFEKAWHKSGAISSEIKEVITKTENFEISNPEDLMTSIGMEFMYGGAASGFSMAFPSYIMEPMLKKNRKNPAQEKKQPAVTSVQPYKYEKIKDVKIDCAVVLSGLKIRLRDIVDVQVGDCIKLEQDIYRPLEIKFGENPKFTGVPGLRGRKMAVKVTGIIKGGSNGRD